MKELQITVSSSVGTINTNFSELKCNLQQQMEVYKELDVTENNKVERKKDIATLRKMQKALIGKYSEARKEFLKPVDELKAAVDELTCIINEPITLLDSQVKEFEEKQRIEKKNAITEYFNSKNVCEEISLDQIYDGKWENVTVSMKTVKADIDTKITEINNNIILIKSMNSEKCEDAMNLYLSTLNVTSAISMINNYEQQKKIIEERMKKEQEERRQRELETERQRIREEERKRIIEEERIRNEEREKFDQEKKAEHEAMEIKKSVSEVNKRVYEINASNEEFVQIEMYMNSLGINYVQAKRG